MKGCMIGNTGAPLDSPECFGAGSLRSSKEADNCRAKNAFPEDVGLLNPVGIDRTGTIGGALDALPGCNPIQPGPERATKQTCSGPVKAVSSILPALSNPIPVTSSKTPTTISKIPATSSTVSKKSSAAAPSPSKTPTLGSAARGVQLPQGWTYSGCFSDKVNPRSLGTQGEWWGEAITSTGCVTHCNAIGKSIAGTENGGQCFCGNELKQSKEAPGGCDQACAGDASQMCGGRGTLSIFRKSTTGKPRHRHRLARSAHH